MPRFSDTTKMLLVQDLTMTSRHLTSRSNEVLAMLEKLHSTLEDGEEPTAIDTDLIDQMRTITTLQEKVFLRLREGRNRLRESLKVTDE